MEIDIPCERVVTRQAIVQGVANTLNTWWALWHHFNLNRLFKYQFQKKTLDIGIPTSIKRVLVGNQWPNGETLLEAKRDATNSKPEHREVAPAHDWRPVERCGKHVVRPLLAGLASREHATGNHAQVNETYMLENLGFHKSAPGQPSEDRPVVRASLLKQLEGSGVRLRNDKWQATTSYVPARMCHESQANRCTSFPISSGHEPGRQKDLV